MLFYCCHVRLFVTSWAAALQASLSFTIPQSLLKVMSTGWVMPSNYLILCHPLLLLPSIFSSIRVFSSGSALCIRWPNFGTSASTWSFQLIFRVDFLYDWLIWSCCPRDSQESSSAPQFESINSMVLSLFYGPILTSLASLVAQMVKNLPVMRDTKVLSLGLEDSLAKQMATHSSILAWRVPWTEESGKLQSIGSQRIGHDWVTNTHTIHTHIHTWLLEKP